MFNFFWRTSLTKQNYDEEVDFFKLLLIIWKGKWLISLCLFLGAMFGLIYVQNIQQKYEVSAPYNYNIHQFNLIQLCQKNVSCIESLFDKQISASVPKDWTVKRRKLSLVTTDPLDATDYEVKLESLNKSLNTKVYEEALEEIKFIQESLSDHWLGIEPAAENMLFAKRIVYKIDKGENVINFGSVSIEQIAFKKNILFLSTLLGGIVGIGYLLNSRLIRRWRSKSVTFK